MAGRRRNSHPGGPRKGKRRRRAVPAPPPPVESRLAAVGVVMWGLAALVSGVAVGIIGLHLAVPRTESTPVMVTVPLDPAPRRIASYRIALDPPPDSVAAAVPDSAGTAGVAVTTATAVPQEVRPVGAARATAAAVRGRAGFSADPQADPSVPIPPRAGVLRIVAVGDVLIGGSVGHSAPARIAAAARPLHPALAAAIGEADVAVANLEGVIGAAPDLPPARPCGAQCWRFRMPPEAAERLAAAGFTHLARANNHAFDFARGGYDVTTRALDAAGLSHAGIDAAGHRIVRTTTRGVTTAFLSFGTSSRCCLDLRDGARMRDLVSAAAGEADVVIVAFHGGAEGRDAQRLPKRRETFLGRDRGDVFAFARAAVDAGADVVVGSGPHVPRAVEVYRGRVIAYSLGNFWTVHNMSLVGAAGLAPILRVDVDREGRAVAVDVLSARQTAGRGPAPDPEGRAAERIAELTALDFPAMRRDAVASARPAGGNDVLAAAEQAGPVR